MQYVVTPELDPYLSVLDSLSPGDDVEIRHGRYYRTKPIHVTAGRVSIHGTQRLGEGSAIRFAGGFLGRSMVFAPPGEFVRSAPSLVPGPGSAYPLGHYFGQVGNSYWINLSRVAGCNWNNSPTLFVGFWYRPLEGAVVGDPNSIVWCGGSLMHGEPEEFSWAAWHRLGDSLQFTITTTAGTFTATTPAGILDANETHYVSCWYDGSNLHVWVNGLLRAAAPATGLVIQKPWHETFLGPLFYRARYYDPATFAPKAIIDSLLIAKTPPVAACVVPSAKHEHRPTADYLLMNFEDAGPGLSSRFTLARACGLPVYLAVTDRSVPAYSFGVRLAGLALECVHTGAPLFMQCPSAEVEDCHILHAQDGITFETDGFLSSVRRVAINMNALAPIGSAFVPPGPALSFTAPAVGVTEVDTFFATGGLMGLSIASGNGVFRRLFLTPAPEQVAALHLSGVGTNNCVSRVTGLYLDDENSPPTLPRAPIILEHNAQVTIETGSVESFQSGAIPSVIVNGGDSVTISDIGFRPSPTSPGLFKVIAAPRSLKVVGHTSWPDTVPVEDPSGITGVATVVA